MAQPGYFPARHRSRLADRVALANSQGVSHYAGRVSPSGTYATGGLTSREVDSYRVSALDWGSDQLRSRTLKSPPINPS